MEEEEDGHIRLKANTDLCTTGLYLKSLHNVSIYLFIRHKTQLLWAYILWNIKGAIKIWQGGLKKPPGLCKEVILKTQNTK